MHAAKAFFLTQLCHEESIKKLDVRNRVHVKFFVQMIAGHIVLVHSGLYRAPHKHNLPLVCVEVYCKTIELEMYLL